MIFAYTLLQIYGGVKELILKSIKENCPPSIIAKSVAIKNCYENVQNIKEKSSIKKFISIFFYRTINLQKFPKLYANNSLQRRKRIFTKSAH